MNRITLNALYMYPVKSLGAVRLEEGVVEGRGLRHDRRWILVDESGTFMTQREHPRMATIRPAIEADCLRLTADGAGDVAVPLSSDGPERESVRVWRSSADAVPVAREADAWLSGVLGVGCRLLYMPDDSRRPVNPAYAVADDIVSFADGYPFLLASEDSLADLNSRLADPVPVSRFRPNFVVAGAEPFAEDAWSRLRIGDALFHGVKGCDRCTMTTIDQSTGRRTGKEPLKTLATYRTTGDGVIFGRYLVAGTAGVVRVGDALEVLDVAQTAAI